VNQRWRDYAGLSAEESQGWAWQVAIHPEDLPSLMEKWRELLRSGEPGDIEARMRRHDGVFRWFLIRFEPFRDESGKIAMWYGVSTDIEDLKQIQERLREDERELRQITDAIPQTIVVQDPSGVPIYANQATLDYTGLTTDDVIAPNFRERIFHPEDLEKFRNERKAALARGLPFEFEHRALGKDGKYRWFLIQYNPFRNERGQVTRWYATGTDIDDRVRAEESTRNENLALREQIDRDSMFEDIVGSSEALRKVLRQVTKVAASDSTVLILGETGTGKELIARAIHKRSRRVDRAFIGVNCAAIPPSLIASELFGHEKGAFTGATQRRLGRFESANGGTIFLDEVGDLPPEIQIALLRVLQEREIERVGGNKSIAVDVRVLAATHRDLNKLVAEGKFRQDLLYRLNVVPIEVPPLRERAADIRLLVEYFMDRFGKRAGKKFKTIDQKRLELFQGYGWPGNVRELQNVIERAVILSEGETFSMDETCLDQALSPTERRTGTLNGTLLTQEKEMIEAALALSQGQISGPNGAAAKLGLPARTLDSKIKRLGINKYRYKVPD
jgi:formate hydrogenlyase transcriptional activator